MAVGLLHYGKKSHPGGETEVEKTRLGVGNWFKRINSWLKRVLMFQQSHADNLL